MNIFVDYVGHPDLFYSMYALFEKRLGHHLFRPDGSKEWEAHNIKTAAAEPFSSFIYYVDDIARVDIGCYPYTQSLLSFSQFASMKFDLFVITCWENEIPICDLADQFSKYTPVIRHIANIHEKPVRCSNILLSTLEPMPSEINWKLFYPEHGEEFKLQSPCKDKVIRSFSNHLPSYPKDMNNWQLFKRGLPEYKFFMHGRDGFDRHLLQSEVEPALKDSLFVWHMKPGTCGYSLRQALAMGRPCIVDLRSAKMHKTIAQNLLVDGFNCIDINPSVRSISKSIKIVRDWSKPDLYLEKTKEISKKFGIDVNFKEQAIQIENWILNLNRN